MSYVFPSSINSSSVGHVSIRTCHKSIQTSYSSGTILDGGSLASHSSQHVGKCSLLVSCLKGSCHGCFGRLDAQGLPLLHLTLWLLRYMCCVDKGCLPEFLRH